MKPEEVALRRAEWYQRAGVELVRGVEAVSLLPGKVASTFVFVSELSSVFVFSVFIVFVFTKVGGEVVLSGGDRLPYSRLLIATGSVPRKLGVPGQDLDGVETLRCRESLRK